MLETHEKIKLLRTQRNMSQEDMANKLNLSLSGYRKIENGSSRITQERIEKLAEILEIPPYELIPQQWSQGTTLNNYGNINDNASQLMNRIYTASEIEAELKLLQQQLLLKMKLFWRKPSELKTLKKLFNYWNSRILKKNGTSISSRIDVPFTFLSKAHK